MTEYDRGRAAGLAEAVAECERIIANPKPGLWNYGTHPSRLDEAMFNGRKEAAQDLAANIAALSTSPGEHVLVPREGVYEHRKGGTYDSLGLGRVQTDEPLTDMAEVVIYLSRKDGSLWARRKSEFEDGRFTRAMLSTKE